MKKSVKAALGIGVAMSIFMPVSAIAQVSSAGAPASADTPAAQAASVGLDDIVVTARKREESLQDVGSAVTALSPAELARRPDVDLSSFSNAAPNVIITDMQEGPGSPASMTIRGVGTSDHERSIDPTIGVVVDGVFIGTVGGAMVKAIDLERLEILRGPQGTLFGRNSIGGALLLDRRKPETGRFNGEARANYGNYNDVGVDGFINAPLTDNLAIKVGGAFSRRDGYTFNRTLNRRQGKEEYKTINAAIRWQPTDKIDLYYRYDKQWTNQDAAALLNVAAPDQAWCSYYQQCAASPTLPQGGDRYVSVQNSPGFGNAFFDSDMHVFSAHWEFADNYSVDYLFGRFLTRENGHWDFDGTPLTLYDTDRPQTYRQNSHELRLSYANGGSLNYTVGLYAFNSRYKIDNFSTIGFGDLAFGLPAGTLLSVPQTVEQSTDSYAAFFEGDVRIINNLTLTLGGRYTHDKKFQGVNDPLFPQLATAGGLSTPVSKAWEEFTPKVGLRYRFSDDFMVYGLFSRGFRAGGFSGRPGTYAAAITPYDPETVDNLEAGFKSQFLDNRVRLNVSAYYMKYKDKQEELSVPVNVLGGTGQQTLFVNAATAELKGVEIELTAKPVRGFTITSSLGYLDARYKKFADPVSGNSLTYLALRRAPKWTFTISPAYGIETMGGKLSLSADWHYVSAFENTFWNTPQARNDGAYVLDAQVTYRHGDTSISLYGRNLTKDDSYTIGLDVGRSATSPGLWTFVATRPPRTYGISISQKF